MDSQDPLFAELADYASNNPGGGKLNDASSLVRASNLNLPATAAGSGSQQQKPTASKAVQLKAENYDLWFQNERLVEENGQLAGELAKLQEKHDKLAYLARNRLGEIKTKYTNMEQDNVALRAELDKLIKEYEKSKKLIEEYKILEEKFKFADRDMRAMIEQLQRGNDELKSSQQALGNEVELLREKYYVAKQNLEKTIRESSLMKEELTKTLFMKDTIEQELARVQAKLNEHVANKKATDEKLEAATTRANTTSVDLRKSEANAAMIHERYTLLKAEKEALEADSKSKIAQMLGKLKELQTQNKQFMDQLKVQSKQCDHLNEENKQLLTYVNGYRNENDMLAKQLASVNAKQKRLALELEKLRTNDQFQRNEEAIKTNEALMGLTAELNNLRKMHANTLTENQRIKEMLIEKDSVLSNLGYERHQLQDRMVKNQHTIAQLERMLKDNQKPFINGISAPTPNSQSAGGTRTYEPINLPDINY